MKTRAALALSLFALGIACQAPVAHSDAGQPDAGQPDAGQPDAGQPDAGTGPLHFGAAEGILDVSTYTGVYRDGTHASSTRAGLQQALLDARDRGLVAFFPAGTYLVDGALSCEELPDWANNASRDLAPCVVMGSRRGEGTAGFQRPVIELAANTFSSTAGTVLHLFRNNAGAEQFNITFSDKVVGLDFQIDDGNPLATALDFGGAQFCTVQDVSIRFAPLTGSGTSHQVGYAGGIGGGGVVANLAVYGGDVGLDYSDSQVQPTVAGLTLDGQRQNAIYYGGRDALVAVGVRITRFGSGSAASAPVAVMAHGTGAVRGQVSLIDSTLDMANAAALGVQSNRSVYLRDVYVRGGAKAVKVVDASGNGLELLPSSSSWLHFAEHARGVTPPPLHWNEDVDTSGQPTNVAMTSQLTSRVWSADCAGASSPCDVVGAASTPGEPPADLAGALEPGGVTASRHLWTRSPSWESEGALNVKALAAQGDGQTDDTASLQAALASGAPVVVLPKGNYLTSASLSVPAGVALVGVDEFFSRLSVNGNASAWGSETPPPLLTTAAGAPLDVQVSMLTLAVSGRSEVIPLEWRAGGPQAVTRMVSTRFDPSIDAGTPSSRHAPLFEVSGAGGGQLYAVMGLSSASTADDYAAVSIRKDNAVDSPLAIYHANVESSRGESQVRIYSGQHIDIFGIKAEGATRTLWASDAGDVNVYGNGGNANPAWMVPPRSTLPSGINELYLFDDTVTSFRAANLVDLGDYFTGCTRPSPCKPAFDTNSEINGYGLDPATWSSLSVGTYGATVPPLERPVLVKK